MKIKESKLRELIREEMQPLREATTVREIIAMHGSKGLVRARNIEEAIQTAKKDMDNYEVVEIILQRPEEYRFVVVPKTALARVRPPGFY